MTTWASIASNELLIRQDIEDNINNGTFARKSYFDLSGLNYAKTVTKDEINSYIYFTPNSTYYPKTGNQEIAKRDITSGSAPAPDRYFLTLYVNCSATGTTTTANLGGGVNAPLVNQFVTISGNSGCWKVTAIDQSSSVSSTINGAYGSDCACGYVVPNRYFLTRYSSCSPTSDTTTADLASGLSVPTVGTFVNITGLSGCWKVTSIDQSTSAAYTITNLYGIDCACSQPSISSTSTLSTFATCLNVPSAPQTITVSGINLTNSIIVSGDTELQFSLTNNNDYTSSVTITPTSGTVSSRTVYVRYTGASAFSSGLLVYITSVGASGITLSTGTASTYAQPTITSVTNGSRNYTGTVNLSATVSSGATADWYANQSGGTALATGTLSFTTPIITQTTTYYVQARDTSGRNCINTSRTAVTATVNIIGDPPPVYPRRLTGAQNIIETSDGNILVTGANVEFTALGVTYSRNGLFKIDSAYERHDLGFTGPWLGEGSLSKNYNGSNGELIVPYEFYIGTVYDAAQDPNGTIIITGNFTFFNGQRFWGTVRLDAQGNINPYDGYNGRLVGLNYIHNPLFGSWYRTPASGRRIHRSPSTGKITIGGAFDNVDYVTSGNICRINSSGLIDNTFSNNCRISSRSGDFYVEGLAESNQGFYIVGKISMQVSESDTRIYHGIIRVNSDGTTDFNFNSGGCSFVDTSINLGTFLNPTSSTLASAWVNSVKVRTDSIIVIGGYFKSYLRSAVVVANPNHIISLNPDGSVVNTFGGGLNEEVLTMDIDSSNRIIAGGKFSTFLATPYNHTVKAIIRYNSDYTIDYSFMQNVGDGPQGSAPVQISIIKNLSSGKIIVYGVFDSWNGNTNCQNIALLNNDGTLAWS